ncbi:MAG: transposase [Candidatus Vogelbacteria bacterium]|nr:transposase [Candidatus Vogelbacteria bacterium]
MSRKINFAIDEYYHVYNRGTDKRVVFSNNYDKDRFLKLLYLCNSDRSFHFADLVKGNEFNFERGENLVEIVAYCLMDNHFHLLLKEIKDGGVSTFMHKLATSYTMYFNKINERKGSLFESNFNAKHLDDDNYLKCTFAYIHLNPIKIIDKNWKEEGVKDIKKAKEFLNKYYYSSYLDYKNTGRSIDLIIKKDSMPEYFQDNKEIEDYIEDWLKYSDHEA